MNYYYVCTRIRARKRQILQKLDYEKMISMGNVKKLFDYLKEGMYRKDFPSAAEGRTFLELIYIMSFQNYGRASMELYKMTSDGLKGDLIPLFLESDLLNLLTILRGKYGKINETEIFPFLLPSFTFSPQLLKRLYSLKESEIVTSLSNNVLMKGTSPKMKHYELENRIYFNWLSLFKQFEEIKYVKDYVHELWFVHDVLNLFKSALYEVPLNFVLSEKTKRFLKISNPKQLLNKLMIQFGRGTSDPVDLEKYFEMRLLMKSLRLMHMKPISIAPIIGYLENKKIEARNIRIIGYGLESNMSPDEIKGELIYENGSSS